jgi:hypothetical protein
MDHGFKEEDVKKMVALLNMVSKHAQFKMSQTEMLEYVRLLSHAQGKVLPKMQSLVLEIKEVIKPVEAQKPVEE